MADFNLSAEVSMDVDPLKASKTTIERNLKAINKSLRDQRKEFKQNEVSAEALAKQETDLGRAVKLQEGLLKQRNKTLNDMQRQMKESNNVTDEQKLKLQNASRAVQQAENQLNNYENELKQTQTQQKLLGRTTDQVKNSLGQLRNEAKLTEMRFKQSEKSVSGYKNRLAELSHTMQKQKAHTDLLKGNLRELERAQQGNSREAKGLRNDLIKEALAFQVLQGRIDETTDELKAYQRQQRLMGTATNAWVGAREQMDRIATTLRSLGEITQGVVGGVMTTHFSALVPILGSVVSLGAGLGGMLTAAAGGAIGMGGAFGIAGIAVKAFAGQATYALKMLEDGQLRVTKEVSAYQTALSGLKTSWEGLIAQNQAAIFNTMTNGINTAKYALTTLNPFLTKTASQIEVASGKMLKWAKTSDNAKRAFDILNTQGPKIFQHLLNATQSFVNGSAALFNKLSPLYGWAAKGFADMAKSFDDWANSVQGSKAINGFVEYTKTNLPIVGSIFGNIFKGIISLFQAFSGHSHNVLLGIQDVTKGFAEWSEGLKKSDGFQKFVEYLETNGPKVWSLIKNITGTLWGLVKGMAPVGAAVLTMSSAFFKWTNTMTNAHPILGKILGVLTAVGGVALLAAKPILLLRGALLGATGATTLFGNAGALAAAKTKIASAAIAIWRGVVSGAQSVALAYMYATNGMSAAQMAQAVKAKAAAVAQGIWNGVTAIGRSIANGYRFAIAALTTSQTLNAIKTKIATAAMLVWTTVSKGAALATRALGLAIRFMTGPIGIVITVIGLLVAGIVHLWKTNETFRNVVIGIWNSIKNAAVASFGFIKVFVVGTFNFVKNNSIKIWQSFKNILLTIIRTWVAGVRNNIMIIRTVTTTVFNFIKSWSIKIWTSLKNGVLSIIRGLTNGTRNLFNILKSGIVKIISTLRNWLITAWTFIKNKIIGIVKSYVNTVRNNFNFLKNGIVKIISNLRSWLITAWNFIKNKTVSIVRSLWSGMKNIFNSLSKGTRSIFNSVKNFLVNLWLSVKNRVINLATSLWNGMKARWNSLSKGTRNIYNSIKNFLINLWLKTKNKVVDFAKNLLNGVKDKWSSLLSSTKKIMNSVANFTSDKWRGIKDKTIGFATTLKDKVIGAFGKMRDTLKGIIDKIKGFISDMVDKVKGGLNKLIDGVNWVGGKLGMDKLPKIKLHTGTEHTNTTTNVVKNGKIARDTFATVGDKGKGNGPNGFRHETIRYPNGKMAITPNKDTTAFLPQGSSVMNGAQTHAMLSANNPTFSKGTLPRFASGTGGMFNVLGNGKKPKKKKHDNHNDAVSEKLGEMWGGTKKASGAIVEGGKKAVSATLGAAAKGKDWLKDKVGDVMDWIEKPGKLLNKILDGFGVNMEGFGIPKAASLPFDMMKGMFGKLKKAATDTFKKWMEEQGGGDGGYIKYLDNITTPYSPNGPPPGYAFNWAHPGIDLPYINEPVHSTISGKAYTKEMPGGFGHYIQVKGGALDVFYGHLSKWLVKNGQSVKPGTKLGISGNTGASTGPHLHYEMHKNGKPIDPVKWLKSNSGGSQNKSASNWKSDIKRAAKQMKVNLSGKELNGIVSQIQRESNGNAGVTQGNIGDINNLRGTPAQGLLQYVPSTFKSYAVKGHKNIKNGYDQLLAFFNNSNWRRDLPYGKSGWGPSGSRRFATGTNNAPRGFAQVFEEGGEIMQMRGGETVIPNDVSIQAFKQIATSDIFSRTQSAVYDAISQYADQLREKQQVATREQMELSRLSRENTDIKEQNGLLKQLLGKMDALLNSNQNIEISNQEIRDKNYFPSSREMTKMNNENMALNSATQLMR
ncbi:peptidoglycan DD-metalloendopeptidase family protein [Staphylococcus saprophyticus]|uniref:peptidoglycan DD-metalloendopeptidase family protein n=1 Tax=Staphylococcus saprophyticus TaxID=29385 RepID=UPI0019D1122A|nr:peptidoglycan DD-metalloendopeptidase family protein [Staphylococcus saprophyticus]MBN6203938.1 peptidoglycan DD-metalloendopeptidase family protein [Staphylococcus saprophyticus]